MRSIRPVAGLRLTWQLNTLMKIEMRGSGPSPRPSSAGGITSVTIDTLPSAGALLLVGLLHLRREPASSTVTALTPGLSLALVPSLLSALDEPYGVRVPLLGLACLTLVIAGARLRWTAPLALGAVVGGLLEADELTVNAPIGREEGARPPWGVLESGKPAETHLRVAGRGSRRTFVELEPLTGRTNQLRIHCAHLGHAVVGDVLYAGEPHVRLCLHAARLAFRHPATNEWVEFASKAPPELLSALV